MKKINFPKDFKYRPHPIGSGDQWCYPDFDNIEISVVRGNYFYSNGVDTYEAWKINSKEDPEGYLTSEQVNKYIN